MFLKYLSVAALQLLAFSVKHVVAESTSTTLTTLPFNFTLAALNTTLPNANSTGAPLVLAIDGASDGIEFYATSTYATWAFDDFPSLELVNGNLRAFFTGTGNWAANATGVTSGDILGWLNDGLNPGPAAQSFSAVQVASQDFPLLAAHGFSDLWSLCPFDDGSRQNKVVFNITADVVDPPPFPEFDPANCFGVVINIVSV